MLKSELQTIDNASITKQEVGESYIEIRASHVLHVVGSRYNVYLRTLNGQVRSAATLLANYV